MSVSTQMQQTLQRHNEQVVAYVNFFGERYRTIKYICNFINVFPLEIYCGKMKRVYVYKI